MFSMQVTPYKIPVKKTSYVPIADGFISSAGNAELSQKYGNHISVVKPLIEPSDSANPITRPFGFVRKA
jgi:hypothetical protein